MGVRPGQWVRVREEVQLRSQVQALRWEQRVPANCQPVREDVVTVKSVGPRESEGAGVLVYRAGDQGPGRLTHEYVLLAALPGSCAFEAPRLLSAGQALSVRVEPVGRIDVINP
jgi:hypothetical protein